MICFFISHRVVFDGFASKVLTKSQKNGGQKWMILVVHFTPQKYLRATVIFSMHSCVKHPILDQNLMALPKVTECLFHLICFR